MENLETLIVTLALMPLFAAIGVTTIAAFALMTVLGLVTEWSFKRIFFASFLMGLIAPILVGAALASSFSEMLDGREFRDVVVQTFPEAEERMRDLEQIGPRVQEIEQQFEDGEISRNEARDQIEQVIQEQTGVQINLDDVEMEIDGGTLRIEND